MTKRSEIGQYGENLAVKHLKNNGYRVLERNYWQPWGEIDIIARRRDGTLIFVEVKTTTDRGGGSITPENQLTKSKLAKLCRTAQLYAGENSAMINDKKGWQIDLVAIEIKSRDEPEILRQAQYEIRHYENIVE